MGCGSQSEKLVKPAPRIHVNSGFNGDKNNHVNLSFSTLDWFIFSIFLLSIMKIS